MKMVGVVCFMAGLGVSWLGMMYGWGVPPVNWFWIVGGSLGCFFLMGIGQIFLGDK